LHGRRYSQVYCGAYAARHRRRSSAADAPRTARTRPPRRSAFPPDSSIANMPIARSSLRDVSTPRVNPVHEPRRFVDARAEECILVIEVVA